MNLERLAAAKERIASNAYAMAGFIDAMLAQHRFSEAHCNMARELLAEHNAAVAERVSAIDERVAS